jgi:predicted nucleotidyltransferase
MEIKQKVFKKEKLPYSDKFDNIRDLILNVEKSEDIKRIYVFGSYIYGKPNKKSDIDLCVLIDQMADKLDMYCKIAGNLRHNGIENFDLLVFKEKWFIGINRDDCVEYVISNYGKILYDKQ